MSLLARLLEPSWTDGSARRCPEFTDAYVNGWGSRIRCNRPLSWLRWVLVGHCGQHQEQP